MEFDKLKQEYIEEIATIIVAKYQRSRESLPLLSVKYENKEKHMKRLEKYIDDPNFIVVIDQEEVIAFMHAFYIDEYKGTVRGALALPAMYGVKKGVDERKVYDRLYKKMSEIWANEECYTHCLLVYKSEETHLNTWFYNGFGLFVIDAVRPLELIESKPLQEGITIRQATSHDLPHMVHLIKEMNHHLMSPPIFLHHDGDDAFVQEYTEWLKIENNILWIAEQDHEIIGYLKTNTSEINQDELNDGDTIGINGAYVIPHYRGLDIMSHLINEAIAWAIEKGLKRCSTDFETANIEGRRYWLKYFTPYSYAVIRRIDERNLINKVASIH